MATFPAVSGSISSFDNGGSLGRLTSLEELGQSPSASGLLNSGFTAV